MSTAIYIHIQALAVVGHTAIDLIGSSVKKNAVQYIKALHDQGRHIISVMYTTSFSYLCGVQGFGSKSASPALLLQVSKQRSAGALTTAPLKCHSYFHLNTVLTSLPSLHLSINHNLILLQSCWLLLTLLLCRQLEGFHPHLDLDSLCSISI